MDLFDELTGEVRQMKANAAESRSENVDLMAREAAFEILSITQDEKLTVANGKLR